jgi:hypothetical protein
LLKAPNHFPDRIIETQKRVPFVVADVPSTVGAVVSMNEVHPIALGLGCLPDAEILDSMDTHITVTRC